jgi:phosphoenolpyruvate-protein phosphotransferase (PTS system enzyme I)
MRKGVPVSPAVAIARAHCMDDALARQQLHKLEAAAVSAEVARLDGACATARQELDDIIARVSRQVGEKEAAIFRAHRLLLDDPALLAKVQSAILDRLCTFNPPGTAIFVQASDFLCSQALAVDSA